MRFLIAVCALAACAQAQVGHSGIVSPDGKNIQFSHDFADSIVVSGPAGIVTKDGRNLQLTHGQAQLNAAAPLPVVRSLPAPALPMAGPSGMVMPDGTNVQFTQEQADNIVLRGPSGIVTKDGKNIQFRKKRSLSDCLQGPSGLVCPSGPIQFPAHSNVAVAGDSGIVFDSGKNIQLPGRRKRSLSDCLQGPSGLVCPSGPIQFPAHSNVAVAGDSGIVFDSGKNIQLPGRKKRSIIVNGFECLQGPSGLNCGKHGVFQLPPGAEIASVGDSGVVTTNGGNFQFQL